MLDNIQHAWPDIVEALGQTFYMLVITIPLAVLLGTPLGTLLYLTRPDHSRELRDCTSS